MKQVLIKRIKKLFTVKTLLWTFVFVFLVFSFMMFADTLALFEDNAQAFSNFDVGRWIIKISDVSITDGQSQEIVVDSFNYEENEHVESGYIAPGTSAYFDLEFDATECDVAVKYDITFNFDSINYSDNISIIVEDEDPNSSIVMTGPSTYSGIISLESIENEETVNLRVYITWENIEDYNEQDTELGMVYDNKLRVPITVNAVQYLGEVLTPYTPPVDEPDDPEEPGTGD